MTIEAVSLRKLFGHVVALDSVSLTAAARSATVIIGPSGGGKSTLLRAISLLDPPESGAVILDGRTLNLVLSDNIPSPIPKMAVVFQQLFLWPHLTLERNAYLPAELRGLPTDEISALASELGIKNLMHRFPNEVSVGQRQRAALLRALALKPEYLLLDEVTSSQDVENVHRIKDVLCRKIDEGLGVLLVTHHIGFARRLMRAGDGGCFAFLDHGRIVESGGHQQLLHPVEARVAKFIERSIEIA